VTTETFSGSAGRRVVAADSAETMGAVKGFVVLASATRIDAIHIDGHGKRATVLPWAAVSAFGADAVIAASESAAVAVTQDHEKDAVKGHLTMTGSRVLTTGGFVAGSVRDVSFDAATGEIVAVSTDQGEVILADRLRSIGQYALIIEPT